MEYVLTCHQSLTIYVYENKHREFITNFALRLKLVAVIRFYQGIGKEKKRK